MPEVASHTDTICELADLVSKYGWTAVENSDGDCELFNRNGKKVVTVKIKGEKYIFYDSAGEKLMSGRGQLHVSVEKLLNNYFYAKKEMAGGGMLVGKSDINGREGILALQPTGELLRVGGGEIVMSEKASTENCEELSKMNVKAGGAEIPCEIKHAANTDRASGKMPKDEYFGGDGKGRMLYGGRVSKNEFFEIDDSEYSWQYSGMTLYALWMSGKECELEYLINHRLLFKRYENLASIKVSLKNGKENSAEVIIPKTLNLLENVSEVKIVITLNFDYYHENRKEFHTLEGGSPEDSKEAILLHEIQHILQSAHNRSCGTSRAAGKVQAHARVHALRDRKKSGAITAGEESELNFYLTLSDSEITNLFYLKEDGEREARKTVRRWLLKKGIRYVDPLTTDFGIDVIDEDLSGGKNTKNSFSYGGPIGRKNYNGNLFLKDAVGRRIFEIIDNASRIDFNVLFNKRELYLYQFFKHSDLYIIYPELINTYVRFSDIKNYSIAVKDDFVGNFSGGQSEKTKNKFFYIDIYGKKESAEDAAQWGGFSDAPEEGMLRKVKRVLIHELQHAIQYIEDSQYGRGYDEISDDYRRRFNEGISTGGGEDRTIDEINSIADTYAEFVYTNGFYERQSRSAADRMDMNESERRLNPPEWDKKMAGGGSITKKPYYLLTKSEIVSERDRLEALPQPLVGEDLSRMRALGRMSIIKHNVLLSKLDSSMDEESMAGGGILTNKDIRSGIVIVAEWLPEWSLFTHAGIISVEDGKAFVYDNDPDNPLNDKGGQVKRTSLKEYLKTRDVIQFYDSGVSAEQIQERSRKYWSKKFDWISFNCETFIKLVTGEPIKRNVLMPIEKLGLAVVPLAIGLALEEGGIGGHIAGGIFGGATAALVESALTADGGSKISKKDDERLNELWDEKESIFSKMKRYEFPSEYFKDYPNEKKRFDEIESEIKLIRSKYRNEGGGKAMEYPEMKYYHLDKDGVISERDRLTGLKNNWGTEEAHRMQSLQRYSVAKFGILLEKLKN